MGAEPIIAPAIAAAAMTALCAFAGQPGNDLAQALLRLAAFAIAIAAAGIGGLILSGLAVSLAGALLAGRNAMIARMSTETREALIALLPWWHGAAYGEIEVQVDAAPASATLRALTKKGFDEHHGKHVP